MNLTKVTGLKEAAQERACPSVSWTRASAAFYRRVLMTGHDTMSSVRVRPSPPSHGVSTRSLSRYWSQGR